MSEECICRGPLSSVRLCPVHELNADPAPTNLTGSGEEETLKRVLAAAAEEFATWPEWKRELVEGYKDLAAWREGKKGVEEYFKAEYERGQALSALSTAQRRIEELEREREQWRAQAVQVRDHCDQRDATNSALTKEVEEARATKDALNRAGWEVGPGWPDGHWLTPKPALIEEMVALRSKLSAMEGEKAALSDSHCPGCECPPDEP